MVRGCMPHDFATFDHLPNTVTEDRSERGSERIGVSFKRPLIVRKIRNTPIPTQRIRIRR